MKGRLTFAALALTGIVLAGLMVYPAVRSPHSDLAAAPELTATPSATPAAQAHLPLIRYDALPTPIPTPTPFPYSAEAVLYITAFGPLNASTFTGGSFVLENKSLGGERISRVQIDLSTAVFPDMVYDPFGTAGDQVAKDLSIDSRTGLDFKGHKYDAPHDGGYDVLELNFDKFDPGDRVTFSVDVDPSSIQGTSAPGPGESGSVCGLELVGSTVTVTFEDGQVLAGQLTPVADPARLGGAWAVIRDGLPDAPVIAVQGIAPPAAVDEAQQTVRVSGPPGQPVRVIVIEGGLYTAGLPGGGNDIDPFEANNALGLKSYSAVLDPNGMVDVPITLVKTKPEGGIGIVTAVFDNFYGVDGRVAPVQVLELD